MPWGSEDDVGRSSSVIEPDGSIRPMRLAPHSVNQQSPESVAVMACGFATGSGNGNISVVPSCRRGVGLAPADPAACNVDEPYGLRAIRDADRCTRWVRQRVFA